MKSVLSLNPVLLLSSSPMHPKCENKLFLFFFPPTNILWKAVITEREGKHTNLSNEEGGGGSEESRQSEQE